MIDDGQFRLRSVGRSERVMMEEVRKDIYNCGRRVRLTQSKNLHSVQGKAENVELRLMNIREDHTGTGPKHIAYIQPDQFARPLPPPSDQSLKPVLPLPQSRPPSSPRRLSSRRQISSTGPSDPPWRPHSSPPPARAATHSPSPAARCAAPAAASCSPDPWPTARGPVRAASS